MKRQTYLQFGGGSRVMSASSFWILHTRTTQSEPKHRLTIDQKKKRKKTQHPSKEEKGSFAPFPLKIFWRVLPLKIWRMTTFLCWLAVRRRRTAARPLNVRRQRDSSYKNSKLSLLNPFWLLKEAAFRNSDGSSPRTRLNDGSRGPNAVPSVRCHFPLEND